MAGQPYRCKGVEPWLSQGSGRVHRDQLAAFMRRCLRAAGAPEQAAALLARVLAAADYRGEFGHGVNRLEMYVKEVRDGTTDPAAEPAVLKQTAATAWVDGRNALGPVVGEFCMRLAMGKAADCGLGWVVAKGSNEFGTAGWYSGMALEQGLIGLAFSNGPPLMSPTRARQAALGTNALSVAAPAQYKDSFLLDMATTAVHIGQLEVRRRRQEAIPPGWAQDPQGRSTCDADEAVRTGCLMPLGGLEGTAGYKGYGLALMVEVLCGVLAGSAYGPGIRKWMSDEARPADLGHCFVALDPACFAPGFQGRLYQMLYRLRGAIPASREGGSRVQVPGDPEREHMKRVDRDGGHISYHTNQLKSMLALAEMLGVDPPPIK